MSIRLRSHAFAGNPLLSFGASRAVAGPSPSAASDALKATLEGSSDRQQPHLCKVLAFLKGRPLARSPSPPADAAPETVPRWHLGWASPLAFSNLSPEAFVYLGLGEASKEADEKEEGVGVLYWAVDVSDVADAEKEISGNGSSFVDLRTLMVASEWGDADAMVELAIAGHARALIEWHKTTKFCGSCGMRTAPFDGGRRRQCTDESCKKRIYPRVDPVVIMLVIDRENDRVLLCSRKAIPRMWSCISGFIEQGESLEEAVRRETWEETGIEVGEVTYHSSQPWPVGPNSMPCQLMVGFFAFAKLLEIRVDKQELEDAQWFSREDVTKALMLAEYKKAQVSNAMKVNQMCNGIIVEGHQNLAADFNVESKDQAPIFIPGHFAIAHHLISTWVQDGVPTVSYHHSSL